MANEINEGNDKVERIDQGDRTSENTADDAVIGGDRQDHQQHHQEMKDFGRTFQGMNKLYQQETGYPIDPVDNGSGATDDESVTIVALNPDGSEVKASGKTGLNENDLTTKPHTPEFFEEKGQGAMTAMQNLDQQPKYEPDQLIAANVTNNPIRSDASLPNLEDVKELPDDSIAQYRDIRQSGLRTDIVRSIQAPDIAHPLAGHELSIIDKIPADTWKTVSAMFPDFSKNGLSSQESKVLVKSILANELHNYDLTDQADDTTARLTGSPIPKPGRLKDDATLGHSQISVNGVKSLSKEFPQLKEYLQNHGYPPGKELQALLDPKMAPMLIAGNVAHNAQMFERHGIPVNKETLAYGFNPDISFRKDDPQHKQPLTMSESEKLKSKGISVDKAILPSPNVLEKSEHLGNVKKWMEWFNKSDNE